MTPAHTITLLGACVVLGVGALAHGQERPTPAPVPRVAEVVPRAKLVKAVTAREAWRAQVVRLRAEVRDLRTLTTLEPSGNRELGRRLAADVKGWTGAQWAALDTLWGRKESGWAIVWNRAGSGACHIPQALPCSKIPGGINAPPGVAIRWGLDYIDARYGDPLGALAHSNRVGWY